MMSVGDYCRAEIEVVAEEEWIVTMDDFLRRRTRLGQLERPADLRADPGVVEASRILLSDAAARGVERRAGRPHDEVESMIRATPASNR